MAIEVSIVVPVYNVRVYLERCLDSLLNQTFQDIEIILINDGSTDGSDLICNEFATKSSYVKVVHQSNQGLGFARNAGIRRAIGEFVIFVDSDDFVATDYVEKLYLTARRYNLDTVFCGFNTFADGNITNSVSEVDEFQLFCDEKEIVEFTLDMIGNQPHLPKDRKFEMSVWHALYSRRVIVDNKVLFPSERELISEDIIFHLDYLKHSRRMAVTPECYYFYCENIGSSSLTKNYRDDRFEKYVKLYHEIIVRYKNPNTAQRAARMLIGYTRSMLFQTAQYNFKYKSQLLIIQRVVSDRIWNDIFSSYPYFKLPLGYALISVLIKWRCKYLLFLAIKLKSFLR